jgi:hypothetical protein
MVLYADIKIWDENNECCFTQRNQHADKAIGKAIAFINQKGANHYFIKKTLNYVIESLHEFDKDLYTAMGGIFGRR